MNVRRLAVGLALLVAAACAGEPPRVDEVVPRAVEEGSGAEITVRGAGFHWRYDSLTNEVSGSFKVRAGDLPLEDVAWIDATELRARVPGMLAAGRYDVTVEGPFGSDTREGALQVRPAADDDESDAGDAGSVDGG